jgi:hypothetical protein
MSNVPRGWRTDEERRLAGAARWPVLARLPDASGDAPAVRFAKPSVPGGIEYRFDPPQPNESSARSLGSAQAAVSQQPHMFERGRPKGQRGIPRRMSSSVLPQSNPFANPRPRLIDSVAPAVRFLTMVALFTAAGLWIQMLGRHAEPKSVEPPQTAAQPAAAPAKSADDHTQPGPTASGPIEAQPEPVARFGRADGDDFAAQNNSAAGPVPAAHPTLTPPHFLISADSHVPRVRVVDSTPSVGTGNSAQGGAESDEAATMARCPGFDLNNPTR